MMEITYSKSYKKEVKGVDWIMYSDVSLKDSLIIYQLHDMVIKNTDMPFDNILASLQANYKHKTCKSRCDIYGDKDRIEVIVKGVFPRFYIQKEHPKQQLLNN